ncbi:MAG TPA: crossover junction endodeoxyribonuclease RuvC [Candidatus Binatia bacterium]
MRVLGVDPGTVRCGWAVVELTGPRLEHLGSGVIDAGRGAVCDRLLVIHRALIDVIESLKPDAFSLERNFVARNVQSAFRLGEARGVAMAAAAAAGLGVAEYTPMMIKKAVVGYGRAEKLQVQMAVQRLLSLPELPMPDAADALAAALCHGLSGAFQSRVADSVSLRGLSRLRGRSWRTVRG